MHMLTISSASKYIEGCAYNKTGLSSMFILACFVFDASSVVFFVDFANFSVCKHNALNDFFLKDLFRGVNSTNPDFYSIHNN